MNKLRVDDDKLNMFIDGELDTDEASELHEALLESHDLRERACQLKAVRDMVSFAYQATPVPEERSSEKSRTKKFNSTIWKCVAACMLLTLGVLVGWSTHQYGPRFFDGTSTASTGSSLFRYYNQKISPMSEAGVGRYILHLSSSNYSVVKTALDDADNLIASYKRSHIPLKIEIVADHTGIDVLRSDVSPYRERIEKLLQDNRNVISLYACAQSLAKAKKKLGHNLIMLPGTHVNQKANELIPKRMDQGWVYIKA